MKKILVSTFLFLAAQVVLVADEVLADRTAIFPASMGEALVTAVCYDAPPKVEGYWTPSGSEVYEHVGRIEDALPRFVDSARVRPKEWPCYLKQVAGIIVDGRQVLFVSYYFVGPKEMWPEDLRARREVCESRGLEFDPDWWRKQPLTVEDGGWLFFRVVYDTVAGEVIWYDENGNA